MPIEDWTAYHRAYYYKRRQKIWDYLGGKCVVCGATEDLEVDHIDRAQKSFNINDNLTLDDRMRSELDKCQLLCKPHHWEKTARENRERGVTHGRWYAWMTLRCQCDECCAARSSFYEKHNAQRRRGDGRGPYGRPAEHGERLMYRRGCRCEACRAANAAYARRFASRH